MLLERTRNEITRVAAVRAWAVVAASPLSGDLGAVLAPLTQELTSYMRKANRVLRTGSVTTLEVEPSQRRFSVPVVQSCVWTGSLHCRWKSLDKSM